jgi:hypothetical protein
MRGAGKPLFAALAALAVSTGWQAAAARYNYAGDWTAFFHTAQWLRLPPDLEAEPIYRFPGADAYDGQFYHLIAHDPFLRHGTAPFVDNPRLRWRRILVPGLAWFAAAGDAERIDNAYFTVIAVWVFLGAWWLARLAPHPWLGLAFPLLPATLVSLDRMTVDVALAALCIAFALYRDRPRQLFVVLAAAPLARETGVVLAAAAAIGARKARYLLALLPFALWAAYVHLHTAPDRTTWLGLPFAGLISRTLHPFPGISGNVSSWVRTAAWLDLLALCGIWASLGLAARAALRRERSALHLALYGFAAAAAILGKADIWTDAYSFARTQTPLLLAAALTGGPPSTLAAAMTLPRLLFQLGPQWKGILRGLAG